MLNDLFLAIVQSATEFLPISSSGHLAIFSNLISKPDVFFFTWLHLASLAAVIIFTKDELAGLLGFKKGYGKIWLYVGIATLPAALFGFFLRSKIEDTFSSFLFIGLAYIVMSVILFSTKFSKAHSTLSAGKAFIIGLFQMLALFPGISRSGITISAGLLLGMSGKESAKFSFLLFIPLSLGAFLLEAGERVYFNLNLLLCFVVTLILGLLFLNLLFFLVKKGRIWIFSVYCFFMGIFSLFLHISK